jgi:2'-hydroxyisoflavone reductase
VTLDGRAGGVGSEDVQAVVVAAVRSYMCEDSIAMWLVDPAMLGWSDRSGAAALTAGLRHRPREALLRDRLTWERDLLATLATTS